MVPVMPLEPSPYVSTYLWFDRPVMGFPHAALIDGPLQWLFRKDASGRALHTSLAAAGRVVERTARPGREPSPHHL